MQLTKEQTAEIIDRSLKIVHDLKDIIDATRTEAGDLNDVYRDIGVLGLALKFQLDKDEEYQQAFKTLCEENVRLQATVTTLAMELSAIAGHAAVLEKDNEQWEASWNDFVARAKDGAEQEAQAHDHDPRD